MEDLYVIGITVNFVIAFLIILYLIIKNSTLDSSNINILVVGTIGFVVSSFLGTFIFSIGVIAIIITSISNFLKGNKV
jgi:hypothetical protein